ncbi:hypothetical protein VNO80_15249 [Phaseolus coccineus]|uniref:Uncharacterized protein n=1 Tax=Phaseolus coccineus TaxID=3886 RepID=A0AAN9R2T1_PHACN
MEFSVDIELFIIKSWCGDCQSPRRFSPLQLHSTKTTNSRTSSLRAKTTSRSIGYWLMNGTKNEKRQLKKTKLNWQHFIIQLTCCSSVNLGPSKVQ